MVYQHTYTYMPHLSLYLLNIDRSCSAYSADQKFCDTPRYYSKKKRKSESRRAVISTFRFIFSPPDLLFSVACSPLFSRAAHCLWNICLNLHELWERAGDKQQGIKYTIKCAESGQRKGVVGWRGEKRAKLLYRPRAIPPRIPSHAPQPWTTRINKSNWLK